jgi:hypothetical protein
MNKRTKVQQRRLDELESDFYPLLIESLKLCARGRWGLFRHQFTNLERGEAEMILKWTNWPEVERLRQLANEIQALHGELGGRNEACERFLALTKLRGSNIPGEPKLAAAFLAELGEAS